MPLQEELADQGAWLFRWRSYLPLLMLPLLVWGLARQHAAATSLTGDVACVLLSTVGLALRAAVVGRTPHRTSGRNTLEQVADSLNTTGLYSLVRHPLYLGNFVGWLGVALFPRDAVVLLVSVLAYATYYERIMMAEERFLRGRFGGAFERWAERTPAYLPRVPGLSARAPAWQPSSRPWSWALVLRREYSGMFAMVATFSGLAAIREWLRSGAPVLTPGWSVFLLVGALLYGGLRHAKKSGRLPLPG